MHLGEEADSERGCGSHLPVDVLDRAADGAVEVKGLAGGEVLVRGRAAVDHGDDLIPRVVVSRRRESLDGVGDGARGADLEALVLPPDGLPAPRHVGGLDAVDQGFDRGEDGGVEDVAAARLFDDDFAESRFGAVVRGDVLVVILRLGIGRDPELIAAVLVREPRGEDTHGEQQADDERGQRVLVRVLGDGVAEPEERAGERAVDVVGEALEHGALVGHGLHAAGRCLAVHRDVDGGGHHSCDAGRGVYPVGRCAVCSRWCVSPVE